MQALVDTWLGAINLTIMMVVGWFAVWMVSHTVERRLRRKGRRGGPGMLATLGWVWDNSNVIGIPTLLLGSAYLVWAMNWGPGLSAGPTALVLLAMALAGLLIGFGPGFRR